MRTVTYGAACSLDGFIAGPGGSIDWLRMSPDVGAIMGAYFRTIDTILMGRKTFEFAQAMSAGGNAGPEMNGVETYVFSRTLTRLADPNARLVRDDAGAFVRDLKREPGKGICILGGGELARSLFEARVVDEVSVNVQPVLLGGGVPMFPVGPTRVQLALVESRILTGGCVLANYRVTRGRSANSRKKRS